MRNFINAQVTNCRPGRVSPAPARSAARDRNAAPAWTGIEAFEPRTLFSMASGVEQLPLCDPPQATIVEISADEPSGSIDLVIGNGQAKAITYTEPDGTTVTISLKGTGMATLTLAGAGLTATLNKGVYSVSGPATASSLVFENTNEKTSLKVVTKGGNDNGIATLGRVAGSTVLGTLAGKGVDLSGDGVALTDAGSIRSLTLHDLTGDAAIVMPGVGDGKGVDVALNNAVNGKTWNVASGIKKLSIADSFNGVVTSPWLGDLKVGGTMSGELNDGELNSSNLIAGKSATPVKSIKSITVGQASGLTIHVGHLIGKLTAGGWAGGAITAGRLGEMAIKGDLNAPMTLTGDNATTGLTVGTLTIKGTALSDITIEGDAKAVTASRLRGKLKISGDVTNVKVGDFLALTSVDSVTGGRIEVTGKAKLKSASGSFAVSNSSVFTSTELMYDMAPLMFDGIVGQDRDYDLRTNSSTIVGGHGTMTSTVYSGSSSYYHVEETNSADETQDWYWSHDENGTYLDSRRFYSKKIGATLDLDFDHLRVAPPSMPYQETEVGESDANLQVRLWGPDLYFDGTAKASSRLVGHESVTVPAGTFAAVKFHVVISAHYSGRFDTIYGDDTLIVVDIKETITFWAVPGKGVVKRTDTIAVKGSIPGQGSQSASGIETIKLK